ncbi:hypothetical protein IQ07DRAFT_652516 [Pyrenochaeta sp. DS3sAY3a]|nr:hypothetical protein IQ07DRAFT_652516 [Pyrenochaeta sp. DS3sAY3a]
MKSNSSGRKMVVPSGETTSSQAKKKERITSRTFPFLSLAAELRNVIYGHCLPDKVTRFLRPIRYNYDGVRGMALAQVCQEIRKEFLSLYLQSLDHQVDIRNFERFKKTFLTTAVKCKGRIRVVLRDCEATADVDLTQLIQFFRENQDLRVTAMSAVRREGSTHWVCFFQDINTTSLLEACTVQPTTTVQAKWWEYFDQAVFRITIRAEMTCLDTFKINVVDFFVDRVETERLAILSSEEKFGLDKSSSQGENASQTSASRADDEMVLWARNSGFEECETWVNRAKNTRIRVTSLGRNTEGHCTSWTMDKSSWRGSGAFKTSRVY